MMSLLISLCLKRSAVVEELVEHWQIDHRDAMLAYDVEELCGESVEVCKLCAHMWTQLVGSLLDCKIPNTEETGRAALKAIDATLRAATSILRCVADAQGRGFEIKGAARLQSSVHNLEAIREKLMKKWPFTDHK